MAQQQVSPWSINAAIAALRFFFTVTLERPDLVLPLREQAAPSAGRAEPRGGRASPRNRAGPQVQSRAQKHTCIDGSPLDGTRGEDIRREQN
jgi:hypothetical protein